MNDIGLVFACVVAIIWGITFLLPWQPWRTREALEPEIHNSSVTLADVTVVIPARNEAQLIATTLQALSQQGVGLQVILVDDESTDATIAIARRSGLENLTIIVSKPLPSGWTGKLWAQEQGVERVSTPLILLLDADIELRSGIILSLKQKILKDELQLVSLMAMLRCNSFWEKLLMPAFIYFFKLLYPFALANKSSSAVAAAAGGCILINTKVLREIGGMKSIKHAVIDDCSLAKKIKAAGFKTWIGLTRSVISQRPYNSLNEIWDMVARTAYTQLNYSVWRLFFCTALMLLIYWFPLLGVIFYQDLTFFLSLASVFIMVVMLQPILRFYSLNPLWAFAMPLVAGIYLLMTWSSAIRYWQGDRSRWKGRVYQKA
jgi:hopene-associated glycosyltransferase HpnB